MNMFHLTLIDSPEWGEQHGILPDVAQGGTLTAGCSHWHFLSRLRAAATAREAAVIDEPGLHRQVRQGIHVQRFIGDLIAGSHGSEP